MSDLWMLKIWKISAEFLNCIFTGSVHCMLCACLNPSSTTSVTLDISGCVCVCLMWSYGACIGCAVRDSGVDCHQRLLAAQHHRAGIISVLFCSLAVLSPRVGHIIDILCPFISVLCSRLHSSMHCSALFVLVLQVIVCVRY